MKRNCFCTRRLRRRRAVSSTRLFATGGVLEDSYSFLVGDFSLFFCELEMTLSPLWEQKSSTRRRSSNKREGSSSLGRDDDALCVVVVVALLSLVGGVLVAGCRRSLINVDRGKNFKVM